MFDVISIGDSTIDTLIRIHNASIKCDLDQQNCQICLSYGDKIPVDQLIHLVAGNAANNAVGCARLGLKTGIYTHVGGDRSGKEILTKLISEGVDKSYMVTEKDMESNFSAVLTYQGERTILVYHQNWQYKLPDLDKTKWLYYTSVGESFTRSNIVDDVVRFVSRTGTKMFYNPGTYQLKIGVKKYPQLLNLAEVFIVNLTEARKILGVKEDDKISVKKLLKGLLDLGSKQVIITDSINGSWAGDGKECFEMGIFPAEKVETTGAGDAYATGVLAALTQGKDLPEAMRWGSANAAGVVEFVGPQAGLLTIDKMQVILKENSNIQPKKF